MEKMLITFILFLTYSFFGWINETILTSVTNRKLNNRGFVLGPYCLVYGIAAVLMLNFLKFVEDNIFYQFLSSMVIATIVEYIVSLLLEKLFDARWWDYSHIKFNLNGRICLGYSIIFGFVGVIAYKLNPYLYNLCKIIITNKLFLTIQLIIFLLFIIDFIISSYIINTLDLSQVENKKDSNSYIAHEVNKYIFNKLKIIKNKIAIF